MTILIFGGNGQLGRELTSRFQTAGRKFKSLDLPDVDIRSRRQVRNAFDRCNPRLVINTAAYTNVDRAEAEPETAYGANRTGPMRLAEQCRNRKIPLLHVSTDYVFDGKSRRPYRENDPVSPIGVYAKSKAEGESVIRRTWPAHIILRTSWLYGAQGSNFVKTMLRLGAEKKEIRVVDDQHGCPTCAEDLASVIGQVVDRIESSDAPPWGTYHYCGAGKTTWYGFASEIFRCAAGRFPLLVEVVTPIPSAEYPTPAPRPKYSVLDCGKIRDAFGIVAVPWKESLGKTLQILAERPPAE